MLKSEMLLFALNDLDDIDLESARKRLGYQTGGTAGRNVKKRIITIALAAALILGLGTVAARDAGRFCHTDHERSRRERDSLPQRLQQ